MITRPNVKLVVSVVALEKIDKGMFVSDCSGGARRWHDSNAIEIVGRALNNADAGELVNVELNDGKFFSFGPVGNGGKSIYPKKIVKYGKRGNWADSFKSVDDARERFRAK